MWLLANSVGDNFATGGITAALGLAVTFLMLAVLILLVMAISKVESLDLKAILAKIFPKKNKTAKAEAADQTGAISEAPADDKKLAAAISAAILIVLSEESQESAPKASFIVKSIKRI